MSHKDEKNKTAISKRTAVIVLICVLVPLVFALVLLIAFKQIWALPLVLLAVIIAAGIVYRKRPDFFAALKRPKKDPLAPNINLSSEFHPSSSSRRSYMMLVSISHSTATQQITVNSTPFIIGRAPESDFCIPDNYVSKRHLVIEYVADEKLCYATDVSSNGSYLNSVRMQNNIRRPLHQGDTLQIAGLLFRVEYVHF